MTRTRTVLAGLTMLIAACTGDPMLEPNTGPPEAPTPVAPDALAAPAAPVPAALTLPACTHHWASAVSGTWFTAARWTPASVPGAGSVACIDASGTYTVTLDPANDATPVNLDGIAVGGGGSGTQILALAGTAAVVNIATGMDIKSNGEFTVRGATGMVITAGAIANAGRLATLATCGGCGDATIRADLDNAGTLVVSGNGLRLDKVNGVYSNSGTIDIAGSLLIPASAGSPAFTQQAGSITSSGVNTNGAIFQMQGGTYTYNGGNTIVTTRGLVVLEGVDLVFGPSPTGTATFSTMPSAAGNTFTGNIGATQTVRFSRTGGGTEIPTRTLTLVGDVRNDGVLEISSGVTLPILAGTGTLTNKGTFRVLGNVDSARVAINLLNEGTVEFNGAFLLLDQPALSYINAGEIKGLGVWQMIVDGATLTNQANGKLTARTDLINGAHLRGTGTNTTQLRVLSGSTVDPGFSPGILTVGSLDIVNGGILNIELGGDTAGTGYDQIQVAGQSTLSGGTLNVTTVDGFEAGKCGQVFDIIPNHSPGGIGQFATTNGLDLGNGKSLKVLYSQTVIRLVGLDAGKLMGTRAEPVPLAEGGSSAQYYVCLGQRPNANVTVTPSADAQITVSPASLTFTPADWELPKAFTIQAVDDQVTEGEHTGRVSHTVASTDSRFNNFALGAVAANITDNDTNRNPTAANDQATTAEDAPATITVLTNDSDPDSDALQVSSVTQPAGGSAAITSGGQAVRFTPAANFHGQRTFTYTISDGNGGTATATVTVTVTPVNDDPGATDDAASTSTLNPIVISVLGNDSDVDGDDLSVSAVTQPANGTATITGGGQTVTYTPPAGFSGSATFNYTASDGHGGTAAGGVTVTVTGGPSAVNSTWTTEEDTPLVRNPLTGPGECLEPEILSVTQPASGTVSILEQDGGCSGLVHQNVRFVPALNFTGTTTFTFTGTDYQGLPVIGTITVHVLPLNDNPTAGNDAASTTAPNPVVVSVLGNDSDVDGDPLTVSSVSQPAHGTAAISGGGQSVTYTPTAALAGVAQFTYAVSDGNGGTATATVSVNVAGPSVNRSPLAVNDQGTVASGATVLIPVTANDSDPDGDPLTVTAVTQPARGGVAIGPGGSAVRYTAPSRGSGTATFRYRVTDGRGGSASATVSVTVTPSTNRRPIAMPDSARTRFLDWGSVVVPVLDNDTDPDGDPLRVTSVEVISGRATAVISGGGASITATGNPFFTPVTVRYTVSDGRGGTASANVRIRLTPNRQPVIRPDFVTTAFQTPIVIPVLDNDSDPDGDPLRLGAHNIWTRINGVSVRLVGTVKENPDRRSYTYTPANWYGTTYFEYWAGDNYGGGSWARVTIRVLPP